MDRRNILIILLLITLPFASSGKVFFHRFLSRGLPVLDETAGWRQIYRCPIEINGASATLSVYGCDEPLEPVTAKLKQAFIQKSNQGRDASSSLRSQEADSGGVGPRHPTPDGSESRPHRLGFPMHQAKSSPWITSTADSQVLRLLPAAVPETDKTVIFVLVQSPAEFYKSRPALSESTLFGRKMFPAGRLETTIKNEETGTTMETMVFSGAPGEIADDIAEKLSGSGWKQIYPHSGPKRCFLIFQRPSALCTVMAGPALYKNQSCVTFVYKEIKDIRGE